MIRFLRRLLNRDPAYSLDELRSTGSVHAWFIAVATGPGATCVGSSCAALLALLIVAMQIATLTVVIFETSHPGCAAHTGTRRHSNAAT